MSVPHLNWLDVDEIGERLNEAHPGIDPLRVRFTDLRNMVVALPGFKAQDDHPVNEKILETIQARWYEARMEMPRDED